MARDVRKLEKISYSSEEWETKKKQLSVEFDYAVDLLLDKLGVNETKSRRKSDTPDSTFYRVSESDGTPWYRYIASFHNQIRAGDSHVFLDVRFEDTPQRFHFHAENPFFNEWGHRWVDHCLDTISELRGTSRYYIREYYCVEASEFGISQSGTNNIERDVEGLLALEIDTIHILEIKHRDKRTSYARSFSYALYDPMENYWRIYPWFAGLDSGGGKGAYDKMQKLIQKWNSRCDLRFHKIIESADEFFGFTGIDQPGNKKKSLRYGFSSLAVHDVYSEEIHKIIDLLDAGENIGALAHMRVLMHSAAKDLVEEKNILYDGNKLLTMYDSLISEDIVSEHYRKFIAAFIHVSNKPHHDVPANIWRDLQGVSNQEDYILAALYAGKVSLDHLLQKARQESE